jgi:hypothetical protein
MKLALALLATTAALLQGSSEPAFTPVQPDLLSIPGSLSNAWADYDDDGDLDMAVSLKSGAIRLYRNDRGTLTSVGDALGLPTTGHEYRAISWGDYDGDGRLDLFAGATPRDKPSAVFHNDGARFRNVAEAVGLAIPGRVSRQNNWVDYDNDGDVDLYATNRAGGNRLYRNDGGRFAPVAAGPNETGYTVGSCWLDYDRDGDLDVFVANQSGPDSLWRNDGAAFVNVAASLGMADTTRTRDDGGVGCAVGDHDADGALDIFVPNYGRNTLWKGDGKGFTNVAAAAGVNLDNHAVGAAWGDYDNDGDQDLSVMNYTGEVGKQVPKNHLFRNDGGRFTQVLTPGGSLDRGDHGVAWADFDRDGDLDLSITKGYTDVGGHYIYRNELPPEQARRSLQVYVVDGRGRYTQPGAEVRLFDAAGKVLGAGQVQTGGGYGAQGAVPVHFGLPRPGRVTVEVTFMSPTGRKTQTLRTVDPARYAGRWLVVKRRV